MSIGTDALKFTLKSRIKNLREPAEVAKKADVPGPGHYKSIGFDAEGKYAVSTIPNSRAAVWSPPKSKRFQDLMRHAHEKPDPCTYNPSHVHSVNDSYILSTMKTYGVPKIVPLSQA